VQNDVMMIQFTLVGGVGGVKKNIVPEHFFFDVSVHGPAATIILTVINIARPDPNLNLSVTGTYPVLCAYS